MPDIYVPDLTIFDIIKEKDKIKTRDEFIESLSTAQSAYILGLKIQAVDSASYWLDKYKETKDKKYLTKVNKYLIQANTVEFFTNLDVLSEEYEDIKKEYNKVIKDVI
jgi:hypothetical protein